MEQFLGCDRKQLWRIAYAAAIVGGVYLVFRYLLPMVWPFLLAYLAAGLLRPVAEVLTRKVKMSVGICSVLVSLIFFAILGTGLFFLCRMGFRQLVQFLGNLGQYRDMIDDKLCIYCGRAERFFSMKKGTLLRGVEDGIDQTMESAKSGIFRGISGHGTKVFAMAGKTLTFLLVFFIGTVLILRDMLCPECGENHENVANGSKCSKDGKRCGSRSLCSGSLLRKMQKVKESLTKVGLAYLKTQGILMVIIGGICTVGFTFMKNRYALVVGLAIGLMDAFPVLGSGMILVPWAIVEFLFGNYVRGIVLLIIYLICQLTREMLEPRLLGNQIGIRPIYTLMAMYVGLRLFGVIGFLLGPLGLVIILALWEQGLGNDDTENGGAKEKCAVKSVR